jgi:hypothetical protein
MYTDNYSFYRCISIWYTTSEKLYKIQLENTEHQYECLKMPTVPILFIWEVKVSWWSPWSEYVGQDVKLHLFSMSAVKGSEWSAWWRPIPTTRLGGLWSQYRRGGEEINIFPH